MLVIVRSTYIVILSFFLGLKNFFEAELVYSVMLVSGVQHSDSVIYICVCVFIFFFRFFLL